MAPVRSDDRSKREGGVFQNRDEHRRNTVQRRASLGLDGFEHAERIEGFARDDHGCAVRDAGQVGQDHSEAVIEREGNAEPVVGTEAEGLSAEAAVVEDVMMRERGAFGSAGRATGELDVDRIVEA
jgi:hypothetical protein